MILKTGLLLYGATALEIGNLLEEYIMLNNRAIIQ